jgi:hypothetical protein
MVNTKLDAKGLEDKFYSQPFSFSYSGLSKLLYSPGLFYNHYILQEREEKLDQHLVEGKVIHCLILDNGSFNNQFIVCLGSKISGIDRDQPIIIISIRISIGQSINKSVINIIN